MIKALLESSQNRRKRKTAADFDNFLASKRQSVEGLTQSTSTKSMPPPPKPESSEKKRKRRSLPSEQVGDSKPLGASVITNGHKRSRTVDQTANMGRSRSNSQSSQYSNTSLKRSIYGPTLLGNNLPLEIGPKNGKLDQTHTSYFRLKALGVNPDSKLLRPEVKASLQGTSSPLLTGKRTREHDDGPLYTKTPRLSMSGPLSLSASSLGKQFMRPRASTGQQDSTPLQPASASSTAVNGARPEHARETYLPATLSPQPVKRNDLTRGDEDLLARFRKVKAQMGETTTFFKEARQSLQVQSRPSPPAEKTLEPPAKESSPKLSRTEQRIRMTGAHGLATKPLEYYKDLQRQEAENAARQRQQTFSESPSLGSSEAENLNDELVMAQNAADAEADELEEEEGEDQDIEDEDDSEEGFDVEQIDAESEGYDDSEQGYDEEEADNEVDYSEEQEEYDEEPTYGGLESNGHHYPPPSADAGGKSGMSVEDAFELSD